MVFISFEMLAQTVPFQNEYAFGLDLSFTKQREDDGNKYYDIDGTKKPALQIFSDHGYNWGRLMICNEPMTSNLKTNLEYVVEAAKDLKEYNYHFALDIMLSNGWANPMTQPTPSDWVDMTHEERVDALFEWTYNVMSTLKEAGALPEMVQVGNEIGNGAFWPDGRINYAPGMDSNWENLSDYLNAGSRAIRAIEGGSKVKIMLHVDHGGDIEFSRTFLNKMKEYNVDYDVVGYSFYPWSHGTLLDLKDNMRMTALRFEKEIIVIETGYYWRENDRDKNPIAYPFPRTPEGQKEWFQAVNEIVLNTPNGLGRGVFWWEPMGRGRGFFDDETHIVKPIVGAFEKYALPKQRTDGQTRIQ